MINENLNFNTPNFNPDMDTYNKIKLDEVIDSIKTIKSKYNPYDELKSAVKILRRFKMTESAKW